MQFVYMTLLVLFCSGGAWYWWKRFGKVDNSLFVHVARFITAFIGAFALLVYLFYVVLVIIHFYK